jgi:hypothetical protein
VIHDRQDRVIPFEESQKLVRVWSGARLLQTEGLGHRRILGDSRVVAETCRFLFETPAPLSQAPEARLNAV